MLVLGVSELRRGEGGYLAARFAYDRLAGATGSLISGGLHDALETDYVLQTMPW